MNSNSQTPYDFNEHKHRYAVWTAARAVQRSFTNTANIKHAIEGTTLRQFAESNKPVIQDQFDKLHREWCNAIINHFSSSEIECSYGRAAKIVAIYLKTSVIHPNLGEGAICSVIHPPIDSILLTSLSQGKDSLKDLCKKRWTGFREVAYWDLVHRLRNEYKGFDWRLEEYWRPEKEETTKQDSKDAITAPHYE
jgi:hypothetical protein